MAGWFDRVRPRLAVDRVERALRDGERYLREHQWDVAERADVAGHQAVRAAIQVCDTLNVPARRRRIIWQATRGQSAQLDSHLTELFPLETHRFLPHAGDDFRAETQLGQPFVLRKARHRWTRELSSLAQEFAIQLAGWPKSIRATRPEPSRSVSARMV